MTYFYLISEHFPLHGVTVEAKGTKQILHRNTHVKNTEVFFMSRFADFLISMLYDTIKPHWIEKDENVFTWFHDMVMILKYKINLTKEICTGVII